MAGLIDAVEELPESDEKQTILKSLKDVSANPTFAAVSGSLLTELIKRLLQQG